MKIILAAITAFLPAICLGQKADTGSNLAGCVPDGEYDPNKDYFPDKSAATESQFWDIQYFNSYKILRNEFEGETFVLYQCGTPIPEDQVNVGHLHFIPVPLKHGVTLASTTFIPHFELLGIRTEIKAWIGDPQYISSPCLNKMKDQGDLAVLAPVFGTEPTQAELNGLKETHGPDILSFHNSRNAYESSLYNVTLSAYREVSNKAIFEWHKFFAVFYNLEAKANSIAKDNSDRYECVAEESIDIVAVEDQGIKPTLVWASYTNYTGVDGWDLAFCPNYYCEYASQCQADLVNSRDGTIDYFGRPIFTTAAFAELAKDADHWIYSGGNWDQAYTAYSSVLDTFKSVKNKQVFDNRGSGPNTWFENRLAEYDVVLQDVCSVVGTGDFLHERVWMRNIFTEEPGVKATECPDVTSVLETRATACRQVVFDPNSAAFCFSGENYVELEGGASIQMKDLSVGDLVKTASGSFESVYTFGHYDEKVQATFVQLFSESLDKPLELTADHMVFLNGKDVPAPARSLLVGDSLLLSDGKTADIVSVKEVTRLGAYAPFTASGSIVVGNVVASNYVSFEDGPYITIAGMELMSCHWMAHLTQAPRRLFCSLVASCENESYNDQGINVWVAGQLQVALWWMTQSAIVKSITIGFSLCFFLLLAGVEMLLNSPLMMATVAGVAGFLLHKNKSDTSAQKQIN